jgi:myo-inositol 2-dehydrogenase/D-chiro-inositol 1-dehydrogenase
MSALALGIIGCGKQGEKHLASLRKLGVADVALHDSDPALAQGLAQAQGGRVVESLDALLADPGLAGVVICTPTPSHAGLIERALAAGKQVFCEKPLAQTSDEVRRIMAAEKMSGRFVSIGYLYRYVKVFADCHDLLTATDGGQSVLGHPVSAILRLGGRGSHQPWKHRQDQGGGAINEMLVHMLDLAHWLLGPLEQPRLVACDLLCPARTIAGQNVAADAEDYVVVELTNQAGCRILCQADLVTPAFSQYLEIQGENGSFMGSITPSIPCQLFLKQAREGHPAGQTSLDRGQTDFLKRQMEAFVDSVRAGRLLQGHSTRDSLAIIALMEQIRRQSAK